MTWLLWIAGAIALLFILGLIFDTNPVLIFEAIIANLIQMAIIIGIGNFLGYLVGSQKGGFVVGYIVCLIISIMGIVNRHYTEEGSVHEFSIGRQRTTMDSRVEGWVGIVMLVAMALFIVIGVMSEKS